MTDRASDVEELDGVVRPAGLVPSFARAVLAPLGAQSSAQPTSPYQEEREAMAGASSRRRTEFFRGRACAHAAVRALGGGMGGTDAPIGVGPGRQPLWPLGVVGSIAHGGRWCGAVAASAVDARGIGLDIEPLQPLPPSVERVVVTSQELRWVPTSHPLARFASVMAFSAKECVYKCLFPMTGWALEFHDVSVEVDLVRLDCRARLSERWQHRGIQVDELSGRFTVLDGHVFAVLCLT